MTDDRNREEQTESTYSGKMGERNRNTPGRTPRELGLDAEDVRGHDILGRAPDRTGGADFGPDETGDRQNPPLTPEVEKMGEGGVSSSGGVAAERGHAGRSDSGAGDPYQETTRSGPAEYRSTSRGDLDHGTVEPDRRKPGARRPDPETG